MSSDRVPGTHNSSPMAWRGLVAALLNEDLRAEYARIVLQSEPLNDRRTTQLVQAGLVEFHAGRPVPATARLRMMLDDRSAERPQQGPGRFLREDGSVDRYPSQQAARVELLRHIAVQVLGADERISEQALNERLRRFDSDTALLRRYFVDYGILARTRSGSEYFYPSEEAKPSL